MCGKNIYNLASLPANMHVLFSNTDVAFALPFLLYLSQTQTHTFISSLSLTHSLLVSPMSRSPSFYYISSPFTHSLFLSVPPCLPLSHTLFFLPLSLSLSLSHTHTHSFFYSPYFPSPASIRQHCSSASRQKKTICSSSLFLSLNFITLTRH